MARPSARLRFSSSAAATTHRNSPATGLPAVASADSSTTSAPRSFFRCRHRAGHDHTTATAHSAKSVPSAKVTRPDAALHAKEKAPHSAGGIGLRTVPDRTRISARTVAESTPDRINVVRTPSTAIRYGEITLYETGCIPPYQARL